MRADMDMERGGELHEKIKEYARDRGIRHSRAYVELLEFAVENINNGDEKRDTV